MFGRPLNRRGFLQNTAATITSLGMSPVIARADTEPGANADDRNLGLLFGTVLGDAIGGPLEFAKDEMREGHVVGARQWQASRQIDEATVAEIARDVKLMSYEKVRPETAAYGPWIANAPAGTITDDSRWKIILIRALRQANADGTKTLTRKHLAQAILDFRPQVNQPPDTATQKLLEEGMREYCYAANWILGERDETIALPLGRLWAGIPNCSGQMMLLPLAIKHAGNPEAAYRESFDLNLIDSAGAKDIASIIVAALSSVLGSQADKLSPDQRWKRIHETMRTLDPFRFKEVPFAGRPLDKWLQMVDDIVEEADGRPAVAYRLLETKAKPVYYWDAHFTLVTSLTLLRISQYDAMCSLAMAIDFGHDTDSYAQLLGAFAGAVYGAQVFPEEMRQTLSERLKVEYGESVKEWTAVLKSR